MKNKILCILCVRGKSKRLHKKNMQIYRGKTLVQHAIDRARESKHIDKIIFGTEDKEMMEHVREIRNNVQLKDWHPERRNILEFGVYELTREITQDKVSMYEPVRQIILKNEDYNLIVILQADSPVKEGLIDECIEKFFEMDKKVRGEKLEDDKQQFEEVYTFHDNVRTGSVRVITRDAFLSPLPTSKIAIMEDREDYVDIQYAEDLEKANEISKHHDTFWVKNKIKNPVQYNTHMIFNHFSRYFKAIQELKILKNEVIIDASCGMGYGAFLLSFYCKKAYGLDINTEYLKIADELYKRDNLRFCTYEYFLNNYFPPVDKIVFIETVEHIPKSEIKSFLYEELFPCLKKDGELFLTAPLGENSPSDYNKYHLNEPSLDGIYDLFKPFFAETDIKIKQFVNSFGKLENYCTILFKRFKGVEE